MLKQQLQQLPFRNNQTGFTIIESLVAVIVLGILMAAIAPTILISTATRIQSRRVELATQAAKAYINGVSTGNIAAPPVTNTTNLTAPEGTLTCNNNGYCSSPEPSSYRVYCVDGNGDDRCKKDNSQDLIIQAFGLNPNSNDGSDSSDAFDVSRGYKLSIRVYRADAFQDNTALEISSDEKKATQSTFTGGIGKRKSPLIEMTTEISTDRTSFEDLCSRLKSLNGNVNGSQNNSQCE